jgi:mono/diheme cytochrome c family protein
MKSRMAIAAICIMAWVSAIPTGHASAGPSVWDGIYTEAQAGRGQALYAKSCSSCHRENLEGHGTTPELAGDDFIEKWGGQTVGDLFEKMQASMPADHPGSLSREQNAAILAFILRFNNFPAGQTELLTDADWLARIRFTAAKPK